SRVKALGEPAIDWGQELMRLGPLALGLPQASQAHGGPQLQRLQEVLEGRAQPRIVIDDKDQGLSVHQTTSSFPLGTLNCTTPPWGTLAVAHSRPPCAS